MNGGGDKFSIPQYKGHEDKEKVIIPDYKEQINNPMIPNDQKRIYNENRPKTRPQQTNQTLELKLFQPSAPRKKPPGQYPHPSVFQPVVMPNPIGMNPLEYAHYLQNNAYSMGHTVNPVYNEYTINIGGVSGSHMKANMIYEDAMPVKNVASTFCTLGERMVMYDYIRSAMFSLGDGDDVPIENDKNNLLSHLKFMDLNPYNAARYTNNPYKGLPFGFLLYRSCYPIRHDSRNSTAICAKNSTGINVRLYRMVEGSYAVNKHAQVQINDYDEWRDIAFYNYVKEHILKAKVCPNFVTMYGYNISLNSNINYDELLRLQEAAAKNKIDRTANRIVGKKPVRNTISFVKIPGTHKALPVAVPAKGKGDVKEQLVIHDRNIRTGNETVTLMKGLDNIHGMKETGTGSIIDLRKYKGKSLVCLTDAANYNLLGWAKKEYRTDGNVKRMVNTGHHDTSAWYSVLFQLMCAMYIMQRHGIVINDFKLDRNVFIRDISINGKVTNHWKYQVQGIDYYIPNHGFLVMIDSNFRDFDVSCLGKEIDSKRTRKLDGKILGSACKLSDAEIKEKTFKMFSRAFDPNIFDNSFINDNGIPPPEDVRRLINNISNEIKAGLTQDIGHYIRKFMTMFLNNRVGSLLNEQEVLNVKEGGIKEFRKGQIVVHNDESGIPRFVIHVETRSGGRAIIITTDNIDPKVANIIEKEINVSSLKEYSIVEPIKQKFNMNESNLNEESLLETYTVL